MSEKRKLLISSDHGGFALKEKLEKYFDIVKEEVSDIDLDDLGPHEYLELDDYPQYAFELAEKLLQRQQLTGREQLGVLICRSGNGMVIAANKVKGIRAALCFTPQHARKAREHDHANILVLDADYSDQQQAAKIVEAFVQAEPQSGRHARRVEMIKEKEGYKPSQTAVRDEEIFKTKKDFSQVRVTPAILCKGISEFRYFLQAYTQVGFMSIDIDIQETPFADTSTLSWQDALEVVRNFQPTASITWDLKIERPVEVIENIKAVFPKHKFVVYADARIQDLEITEDIILGIDFDQTLANTAEYYNQFSQIQLMSITANKQGSSFQAQVFERIQQLRALGFRGEISLDGGVNPETAKLIAARASKLGITKVSVGSYFQTAEPTELLSRKANLEILVNT